MLDEKMTFSVSKRALLACISHQEKNPAIDNVERGSRHQLWPCLWANAVAAVGYYLLAHERSTSTLDPDAMVPAW
jgi:hypothetical protein